MGDNGAERDTLRTAASAEALRLLPDYDNFLTVRDKVAGLAETAIGGWSNASIAGALPWASWQSRRGVDASWPFGALEIY